MSAGLGRRRPVLNQMVSTQHTHDPWSSIIMMIEFSLETPASSKEGLEDAAGSARKESGNTTQDQSKIRLEMF